MLSKERKITDLNVTGRLKGKFEALLGDAHEYIVAGILVRLGFNVSMMAVKGEPYDLLISAFKEPHGKVVILRCQIKATSKKSVRFTAGGRGGIDRTYKSGVKTYKYTTEHNDIIIGVDMNTLDFYLVPTIFLAKWGSSRAFSKLNPLKNNWDILLNWNDDFLKKLEDSLPAE